MVFFSDVLWLSGFTRPLGAGIFTLLNVYIICSLLRNHEQSGSDVESRTKRSETSCKITLL